MLHPRQLLSCTLSVIILSVISLSAKADDVLTLYGRVQDAVWKTELTDAVVVTYDNDGNPLDSIPANKGRRYRAGEVITSAEFYMSVPRVDSTYVFDVVCDKYLTKTVAFRVENVGKREFSRDIPIVFMERAPHKLGEVTVTASKIKFYNKGDTLVYNADAFLLAEGSMLDALIAQLPGVELNSSGEIKVNGEKVETLLLNGKEFFDGDNNLMLENIGAYTVKDINVYSDRTPQSKRQFDKLAPKVLTMDVRLKKEYQNGYILNAQGGYGTEDRYIGRLFASWFNTTTSVSLVANANNLNDNRTPGKNDSWTPDMMPTGRREFRTAGLNFNHQATDDKTFAMGTLTFSQTKNNTLVTNNKINFLPGGDTYENSFGDSRLTETSTRLNTYLSHSWEKFYWSGQVSGSYGQTKNSNSNVSGSFSEDPGEMTRQMLDAIYSDGTPEMLESIINRSNTKTDTWNRNLYGVISQTVGYNVPKSSDYFYVSGMFSYNSIKNNIWRDYDINFSGDPTQATHRRQYTDNTPNHTLVASGGISYGTRILNANISLRYGFEHVDQTADTYMYSLERLNDMGIYGTLPEGYESCLVPGWSHSSRTIINTHSLSANFIYYRDLGKGDLQVRMFPSMKFTHRNLQYNRDGRDYPLSTDNTGFIFVAQTWGGNIEYRFRRRERNGQKQYCNSLSYDLDVSPQLPSLFNMIDIVNDADPLNIYLSNPDLKQQYTIANNIKWKWTPVAHSLNNTLQLHYSTIKNKLVNGYSYEMSTGIRRNRMYNTDGNWSAQVLNSLNWQFGSKKQFALSNSNSLVFSGYADMIGVNSIEPEQTKVRFRSVTENLNFSWQIGPHSVQARFNYLNRHTTSTQPGFRTLDATHLNFGVAGSVKLPAGFSMSTDFMCYTRRGYDSRELDTTDPIWNMRLSYSPPRNTHWVFMVDAFDLLHKLSNVNYAVTASGRTITYTNALPRYVIFSLQYRFNIQPKKR